MLFSFVLYSEWDKPYPQGKQWQWSRVCLMRKDLYTEKKKPLPCYPCWLHCAFLCRGHLWTELLGRRNLGATGILLLLIPTAQFSFIYFSRSTSKKWRWKEILWQECHRTGYSLCWLWELSKELPFGILKISALRHILKEIYILK